MKFKEDIDLWLKQYFENKGSYNKKIYDAMAYSINIGGKRIRPILMLMVYNIYNKHYEHILPIACALEMIHTYSLIHDDLPCMDNDDLRRGKPTNHKVYGYDMAVLAGDGLLNEAFNVLLGECLENGSLYTKVTSLISNAAGVEGMIGGQVVDVLSTNKCIGEEELYYMHKKKTGELIKVAVLSGAMLGGADEREIDIFKEFGEKLGLAFQIKDDILDITGDSLKLGKTAGKDEKENKNTFVKIFTLDKCKKTCSSLTDECLNLLKSVSKDTTDLENLTLSLLNREY